MFKYYIKKSINKTSKRGQSDFFNLINLNSKKSLWPLFSSGAFCMRASFKLAFIVFYKIFYAAIIGLFCRF